MASKIKVDELETVSGSGNIVLNNALSGSGASLTNLSASAVSGTHTSFTSTGIDDNASGATAITISADEEVTMPKQPSFTGYLTGTQSNVSGDATAYAITGAIWSEWIDRNADFVNGTFTAPVAGQYLATLTVELEGMGSSHTRVTISFVTSNRTYQMCWYNLYAVSNIGICSIPASAVFDMDAADTVHLSITITGGTKVVEVNGTSPTVFTVSLLS